MSCGGEPAVVNPRRGGATGRPRAVAMEHRTPSPLCAHSAGNTERNLYPIEYKRTRLRAGLCTRVAKPYQCDPSLMGDYPGPHSAHHPCISSSTLYLTIPAHTVPSSYCHSVCSYARISVTQSQCTRQNTLHVCPQHVLPLLHQQCPPRAFTHAVQTCRP